MKVVVGRYAALGGDQDQEDLDNPLPVMGAHEEGYVLGSDTSCNNIVIVQEYRKHPHTHRTCIVSIVYIYIRIFTKPISPQFIFMCKKVKCFLFETVCRSAQSILLRVERRKLIYSRKGEVGVKI